MGPFVDASSPVRWAGTPGNGTNITSASFTPPNGSLIVLNVEAKTPDAATDITINPSGGSLTWTNRAERDPGDAGAQAGHASIWTAPVGTGAVMTISVNRTGGSLARISCRAYVCTSYDLTTPVGAVAEGSSVSNDVSAGPITSQSNGLLFVAGCESTAAGVPTSADLTADAATYSGSISVIDGYKAIPSAGASVSADLDAFGAAAAAWNWVAVEIRPALGAYTLTASPGSFAEAGNAAGLLVGRKLAAAPGSFALSGTAASLISGRRLAAATGSFAEAGRAAGLIVARRLAAATGTFTLAGSAATPSRGFRLTATAGGFAIAGNAAGLRASRRLAASPGSFSLSGNASGLIRGGGVSSGGHATIDVATFLLLLGRPSGPISATSAPALATIRDRDILRAVVLAIRATGAFAQVEAYGTQGDGRLGAADYPSCVVRPSGWAQRDEGSPGATLRRVRFVLTVDVRDEDEAAAYELLDRLQARLAVALQGSDLGGIALPEHTGLTSGRVAAAAAPEWQVEIQGQSAYLWQSATGLSITA